VRGLSNQGNAFRRVSRAVGATVTRVPEQIASDLAAAVAEERAARTALRGARRRQAVLLRQLRDLGVPFTAAAIARLLVGETASPDQRRRLAATLRQRICRVTERHADQPGFSPHGDPSALPSSERKEAAMANKLVKKTTITEVYEAADIDSELEDDSDQDEVEDEEADDDESERPRKRR
jgi:hypothetical protein